MSKRTLIAWIGFGLALVIFICWVVVFMAFGDKPDRNLKRAHIFKRVICPHIEQMLNP